MLDKMDLILTAVELAPHPLSELVIRTGIPRPTAYRLATALERLGYLERDPAGRFGVGPRIGELAAGSGEDWLVSIATPILTGLRDVTAESAQLYRRRGEERLCVASVERAMGLRDSVPAGTSLPMTAGSAAQVLLAWSASDTLEQVCRDARFTQADLVAVRRRGWAHSVAEREPGLASISAPVFGEAGSVQAAVSISGPIDRIGDTARPRQAEAVVRAAASLSEYVRARRPV
ncbi:MAG: hypothetical protein QG671_3531 [Actinomycetota bacterium]|nr:hypothetical protein [Actinomycetota bacterium]